MCLQSACHWFHILTWLFCACIKIGWAQSGVVVQTICKTMVDDPDNARRCETAQRKATHQTPPVAENEWSPYEPLGSYTHDIVDKPLGVKCVCAFVSLKTHSITRKIKTRTFFCSKRHPTKHARNSTSYETGLAVC